MIIAIIALILAASVGGFETWEALQAPQTTHPTTQTTQTLTVSKGRILLVGNGTSQVAYFNFTVPGSLISGTLNMSITGVEASSTTRLSLLNSTQYPKFRTCNCIFFGNYSSVSTTWSSPLAHIYSAQVQIPSSGKWTVAMQHEPGNANPENFDETIMLTYTVIS
jgi:hypothetical protein